MSTERTVTTTSLLRVLRRGHANGQSANTLAFLLDSTPRGIRNLVDELIDEGTAVCAHPKTGYYVAETVEEVNQTADFLKSRALHGLKKASQLRAAFMSLAEPGTVSLVDAGGIHPIDPLEEEGAFA